MQGTGADRRRQIIARIVISLLIIVALVAIDQVTKLIFNNLKASGEWQKTTVIDGFFYFEYAFNKGAAWSFLANKDWGQLFFKILTSVALIGFIVYLAFVIKGKYKVLLAGTILVISGTIGNFIDRLFLGGVTDFISFYFGSYHFPIFNIADTFLTVGVIIVIVHYLFLDDKAVFRKNANKEVSDK